MTNMGETDIQLSVVLPVRNEKENLPAVITELFRNIGDAIKEIIIVDDCSSDSTSTLADQLSASYAKIKVIHRTPPNGLGRAILDGFANASGNYALTIDSDMEMLPGEIPRMIAKLRSTGCDVVVGSRFTEGSVLEGYSRFKYFFNRAFNSIFKYMLGTHISDLTFGFKILRDVVTRVKWESETHGIAGETTMKPIALGFTVEEVPVSWIRRKHGESKFRISYYYEYLRVGIKASIQRLVRMLKRPHIISHLLYNITVASK